LLDLQLDRLAGAPAAAITETEQHTHLEAAGSCQQPPRLVLAHHQWDLLRFADVIDLGGKVPSPQRHAKQEPQPDHDAVAIADARARFRKVELEPADVLHRGGIQGPLEKRGEPLAAWPLCVPAQSLRAFMSSIMRWRSGLTVAVPMDNSCLG
jgi:hypothetical protein